MRFDLTDEQAAIQETIDRILAERLPPERLAEHARQGSADFELWSELCELGFAGLAVSAEFGGQALGLLELGLTCEAAGAALAPIPLLPNAAAGLVVEAAGSEADRETLLPTIADGSAPASIALLRDGRDPLAIDADRAGALVLVEGGRAAIADADAEITAAPTIDLMRRYRRIQGDLSVAPMPGDAARAIDQVEVLLAAELTGVAQRALDIAVAYAGEREQFGRPIGSFQGVSHRCSQILLAVESARSTWRFASWVDRGLPDRFKLASSTAKVAATTAAVNATAGAMQVLGGIGFTWEHEIHRYLRRAWVGQQILGRVPEHRRRIVTELRRLDESGETRSDSETALGKETVHGPA